MRYRPPTAALWITMATVLMVAQVSLTGNGIESTCWFSATPVCADEAVAAPSPIAQLGHNTLFAGGYVEHVTFAPSGRTMVSVGDRVQVWDAETGQLQKSNFAADSPEVAEFTPTGNRLIVGGRTLVVFDFASGKVVRELKGFQPEADADGLPYHDVTEMVVSPNGQLLATLHNGGKIIVWDLATGEQRQQLDSGGDWPSVIRFSADGTRLISAYHDIRVWQIAATGAATLSWKTDRLQLVNAAAVSPDGKVLAAAVHPEGQLRFWEMATGKPADKSGGKQGFVEDLTYSPDGKSLAVSTLNGDIYLLDAKTCERTASFDFHNGKSASKLAFSRDGTRLASAGHDGAIGLIALDDGQPRQVLTGDVPRGPFQYMAFSPDGKFLATATDMQVHLWETGTWRLAWQHQPQRGWTMLVSSLAFSPDSRFLSYGSPYGVALLEMESRQHSYLGETRLADALAWSPDGKWLATGIQASIEIWRMPQRQHVRSFQAHDVPINCLAFAPDGRMLASGSGYRGIIEGFLGNDDSIRFWNMTTARRIRTIERNVPVDHLRYSPDGKYLYEGGWSETNLRSSNGKRVIFKLDHQLPQTDIGFRSSSPGGPGFFFGRGRYLVAGTDGGAVVWDLTQPGQVVPGAVDDNDDPADDEVRWLAAVAHFGSGNSRQRAVAISPDECYLVTSGPGASAQIWDLAKAVFRSGN